MSDDPLTSQLTYGLPRELDLMAADDLKEKMLDLLHQEGDLILDAKDVDRISTPCIEVIFSAGVAFGDAGRGFLIDNPSAYFSDALTALGLDDHFQCWRAS